MRIGFALRFEHDLRDHPFANCFAIVLQPGDLRADTRRVVRIGVAKRVEAIAEVVARIRKRRRIGRLRIHERVVLRLHIDRGSGSRTGCGEAERARGGCLRRQDPLPSSEVGVRPRLKIGAHLCDVALSAAAKLCGVRTECTRIDVAHCVERSVLVRLKRSQTCMESAARRTIERKRLYFHAKQ